MSNMGVELRGVTLKLVGCAIVVRQSVVPIRALQAALYCCLARSGGSSSAGPRLRILALRLDPCRRDQEAQNEQQCLSHRHSSFLSRAIRLWSGLQSFLYQVRLLGLYVLRRTLGACPSYVLQEAKTLI